MFTASDIYTSSGSTKIYNCWTPTVYKFGTSSFYNWEQDNEPLYDLEERTYEAWEQLGYPTSSIPGLALVVSADAPGSVIGCNKNVFTTLSAAIASLPQVIRFPVLIEVASFGALGDAYLHNIKCTERGSIEIINRNFAKVYSVSGMVTGVKTTGEHGTYNLINYFSSLDLSNTFINTSALSISSTVLSAAGDTRFRNLRAVMMDRKSDGTIPYTNRLSFHGGTPNNPLTTTANVFNFEPYESNPASLDTVHNYDISCANTQLLSELLYRSTSPINSNAVAMVYGNRLSMLSIKNCEGPIYIRNFYVEGSPGLPTAAPVGVRIDDSEIFLENCAAAHFSEAGFLFSHSRVTVLRGIVAYRNYGFDSTNVRKSGYAAVNQAADNVVINDYAAGIICSNSELLLSSTLSRETQSVSSASAYDFMIGLSRNANGIILDNSKLYGGIKRSSAASTKSCSYLQAENNAEFGIVARNSFIDLDGRLESFCNLRGAIFENSIVNLDEFTIELNQHEGIYSVNSTIRYNKNKSRYTSFLGSQDQYDFYGNGVHMLLKSSSQFIPIQYNDVSQNMVAPTIFGGMRFEKSHLTNNLISTHSLHKTTVPSIKIEGNSEATFIHARVYRADAECNVTDQTDPGTAISVRENSKGIFVGTSAAATMLIGPPTHTYQYYRGGAYAKDSSIIEFQGPTVIARYGIDVLAEDNSVINFNPPHTKNAAGVDANFFGLHDPKNHTSVELHSTRTCLVANRNSQINMYHLGDFSSAWGGGTNGINALASTIDYPIAGRYTQNLVSGGSMQFYPNPNDTANYPNNPGIQDPGVDFATQTTFLQTATTPPRNYFLTDKIYNPAQADTFSSITNGGMCIRALGNSIVNIFNVNFPCGWWNASGIIYDASGADAGNLLCNRTFIWNIADNSQLHASYLAVSGKHPADAGYFGPCAVYASGAGAVAYGAPTGTVDTSNLSILDFFGKGTGTNILPTPGGLKPFGKTSPENQGPFRLYTSVDSLANYLATAPGAIYGWTTQIFAQGYNFSGNLSALPSVSSVYGNVLKMNSAGNWETSGFYYGSGLVEDGSRRIILDESAANTFANAKNGAMGTSGRSKICTIIGSHKSTGGEGKSNSSATYSRGFKTVNVFDIGRDS